MSKTLAQISQAGTSIWLDDLSRERMIDNGKSRSLKSLISEESVVGVTTNPAIFSSSISQSALYSDDLKALAAKGFSAEQIITELTCSDVAKACDLFKEVFISSGGVDGRVSIEVDPRFARDTQKTISQARDPRTARARCWKRSLRASSARVSPTPTSRPSRPLSRRVSVVRSALPRGVSGPCSRP